jgi:hypothetical protein
MMTVDDLLEIMPCKLVLERHEHGRWTAILKGAEFKDSIESAILSTYCGIGADADKAVARLFSMVAGKFVIFHASDAKRRFAFRIPREIDMVVNRFDR